MATLQVRQRGTQDAGVLPQVRQVDYSGIGNNAMTQFQARGGFGSYVQDAVKNLANGIGSTVETLNARDERDASIQAEAFRSELTRAKEDFLREMQTNPSSADDAIQRWNAKVNEVKGRIVKNVGADGSYKRDCFVRVTQPFLDNSYVELFRASNKVSDAFNQKTADTTLKLLMEDVVNTSPDRRGDAMQMVANQAIVSADAHHLSAEERDEKWRETRETVALMCANRAIANAASVSDLDKVSEAVTNVGVDDTTLEQQEVLNSVFGGIDYNALTPEARVKLQDAIRRKRTALEHVEADEVNKAINTLCFDASKDTVTAIASFSKLETLQEHSPKMTYGQFKQAKTYVQQIVDGFVAKDFDDMLGLLKAEGFEGSALVEEMKKRLPKDVQNTDKFKTLITAEAKGYYELEKLKTKSEYDKEISKLNDKRYSYDEAMARFERIKKAFPMYFVGTDGYAEEQKVTKMLKADRMANVSGFNDQLSTLFVDKNFLNTIKGVMKDKKAVSMGPTPLIPLSSSGDPNFDAFYSQLKAFRKDTPLGLDPNAIQAIELLKTAYNNVVDVAIQNPTYTSKQLMEIFKANVPESVFQTILFSEMPEPIDYNKYNARLATFMETQMAYNRVYGEGKDVPFDKTMENATGKTHSQKSEQAEPKAKTKPMATVPAVSVL